MPKKIDQLTQEYWWEFYSQAVAADSVYRAATAAGDTAAASAAVESGLAPAITAIMLDPKHWSSRFVFAQLRGFKQKDEEFERAWFEALDALEKSSLKKDDPENYTKNLEYGRLQLIQYYYAKQDHVNTLKLADALLGADAGSVEAVQYKAFSLATMASDEQLSEAERDSLKRVALGALTDAKAANEEDENIIYYIGQFNLQLKDTAAALTAFDEFLSKAPDDRDVLFLQGLIYLEGEKFGDLQKAVDKFGAITVAFPDDGAAWTNYGIALVRQGKTDKGSEAMKKGEALSGN
ncbi:MAG: tetratricopeptide repeat protein [bacterium]|nr:tetratricopeptide repeat protein [bacterium]